MVLRSEEPDSLEWSGPGRDSGALRGDSGAAEDEFCWSSRPDAISSSEKSGLAVSGILRRWFGVVRAVIPRSSCPDVTPRSDGRGSAGRCGSGRGSGVLWGRFDVVGAT